MVNTQTPRNDFDNEFNLPPNPNYSGVVIAVLIFIMIIAGLVYYYNYTPTTTAPVEKTSQINTSATEKNNKIDR